MILSRIISMASWRISRLILNQASQSWRQFLALTTKTLVSTANLLRFLGKEFQRWKNSKFKVHSSQEDVKEEESLESLENSGPKPSLVAWAIPLIMLKLLKRTTSLRQVHLMNRPRASALMNQLQNNRMSKVKTMMMIVCTMTSITPLEAISHYSITRSRISQEQLWKWAITQSTRGSTSSGSVKNTENPQSSSLAAIATRGTIWDGQP